MKRVAVLALAFGVSGCGFLGAESIPVPNGSFESPPTFFVNTHVDGWQKTPKPDWYVEGGGYTWDQLSGVFKNTAPGSADYIPNCDGAQALWIFVVPQVGLFQDYDSIDWSNSVPTHAFNAVFEPGRAYRLTVSLRGGGGGMKPGATLEMGFYYREGASNLVSVASTTLVYGPEAFSNAPALADFEVSVPVVSPGDPWAGRHIGIRLLSTVDPALEGGYWDLDNVRLSSSERVRWTNPSWANGQFTATLRSEPGWRFEVLASPDPGLGLSSWTSLGVITNTSGADTFTDGAGGAGPRFYRARYVP